MKPLDEEQTEQFATTLVDYERHMADPYGLGGRHSAPRAPLSCAQVLLLQRSPDNVERRLQIRLGRLPEPWKQDPASSEKETPLEYAAAFEATPSERDHFLRMHEAMIEADHQLGDGYGRIIWHGYHLPAPSDPSLRSPRAPGSLFRPPHAAWYTPKAIVTLLLSKATYGELDAHLLSRLVHTVQGDEREEATMRQIVLDCVSRLLKRKVTRYTSREHEVLANILSLAEPQAAEKMLKTAPDAYGDLGIAIQDASSETMVRGLRMLAKYKRLEVMRYMARAPTFDELKASNVSGAGLVWLSMPWSLFDPLVKEHSTLLRAQLIRRPELDHMQLQKVLINHEARFELATRSTPVQDKGGHYDFAELQERCLQYFPACRLREALQPYRENTRFLLAIYHLTGREDLRPYAEPLLTEHVRACMAAYLSPIKMGGSPRDWHERT